MTILIADDHPTNRKLLRVVLESEGHTVLEAVDGAEGMAILRQNPVDLVISDILMPHADGYSFCASVRSDKQFRDTPFMIYTASYTSPSDEVLAYDLGANMYLRKPASPRVIIESVAQATQSIPDEVRPRSLSGSQIIKQYSERLVEKLEEKNIQLHAKSVELRETHSRLKQVLGHSPAILYTIRFDGDEIVLTAESENAQRLLGVNHELVRADWWKTSIHPDDRERVIAQVMRAIETGGYALEYRLQSGPGTYRWIEDHAQVTTESEDGSPQIIGIWMDISERIDAQEAIQRSEEQLRDMLEKVDLIAVITDAAGNITFLNRYLLALTGWRHDEVIGQSWFSTFAGTAAERQRTRYNRMIESNQVEPHYESTLRTRDGETRDIDWNNAAILDGQGRIVGIASIGEDITERKRATETLKNVNRELESRVHERTKALEQTNIELQVAKELAEMANQAKSAFLSRMSHEFRTPMNAILGFGQLLTLTELSEEQTDSVNHILKAGRHLLGLINDVLEISRLESDPFGISLEPVSLDDILSECVSLMRPIADARRISMNFSATNATVKADTQRLRQVLLNLISNAVKYNVDEGSVTIRSSNDSEGYVSLFVEDTGFGMPESLQGRLFTPFDRLGAEARNIEGTGLGLSLSRSLTEAMGGKLTFSSEEGKGSVFRVTLQRSETIPVVRAPMNLSSISADPTTVSRIMAIEDNTINSQLLMGIFSRRPDIELTIYKEGGIGLVQAEILMPHVILLDLHLPDMSGREVLKELQESPKLRNIPVIIISADAYSAQRELLIEAGAFRYITKPFELESLINAVNDGIRESQKYG